MAPSEEGGGAAPEPPEERYLPGNPIGRGGMGLVRVALDRAVGRQVALKEVDPALAGDPRAAQRLAREAAIAGRLDHPGIVAVHDAGRLPDGRPYYTMRLVRGRTLARAIAEAGALEGRLALLRHVLAAAEAVAAAHEAGVVHRDLKPANILIGPHGETQVVDWGLAAPTAAAAEAWSDLPEGAPSTGVVGTPAYMSPEQARGEGPDPRHDTWGLGATLYEVLSGTRPPGLTTSGEGAGAVLSPRPLAELEPRIPAELVAIVQRAMGPWERRYPEAEALAQDLLAWFEGRRVGAHDYSPLELLIRLWRVWRGPAVVGLLGLLGVGLAVGVGWWRTGEQRDRALGAEREAQRNQQLAEAKLAETWVQQAEEALERDDRQRAEQLATAALGHIEDPTARGVLAAFGRQSRAQLLESRPGVPCSQSELSPDGSWLLCVQAEAALRLRGQEVIWRREGSYTSSHIQGGRVLLDRGSVGGLLLDAQSGAEVVDGQRHYNWMATQPPSLAIMDDRLYLPSAAENLSPCHGALQVLGAQGRRLAALCSDGGLWLVDLGNGERRRAQTDFYGEQPPTSLRWTLEGELLVGGLRGELALLDGQSGALLRRVSTGLGAIRGVVAAGEGGLVAVMGSLGGVGIWDRRTGGWRGQLPCGLPCAAAWLGPEELLVHDGLYRRWKVPGATPYLLRMAHGVADVQLGAGGEELLVSAGGGELRLFRLSDGMELAHHALSNGVVKAAVELPGGRLAASTVDPPGVWVGPKAGPLERIEELMWGRRLAWRPEGELVVSLNVSGLAIWPGARPPMSRRGPEAMVLDMEEGRDGHLWILDAAGGIWTMKGGEEPRPAWRLPGALAVASAAERVAVSRADGLSIYSREGQLQREIELPREPVDLCISPDGGRVATGTREGEVLLWSTETGRLLARMAGHTERVSAVEFLMDGKFLVSGSWDRTARIWDLSGLNAPAETVQRSLRRDVPDHSQ